MGFTDILYNLFRGVLGMGILVGVLWLLSTNRKNIDWSLVLKGLGLQIILAFFMLKVPGVKDAVNWIVQLFVIMVKSSEQSSMFLFGTLADGETTRKISSSLDEAFGIEGLTFGFAFSVLPTIIFFSALSALLYYFGILQFVVKGFAWVMRRLMRLSGAESLAAAANVFIGQTEAPLVVKPYLEKMTKSEVMCLMTGGMATIAGGVFGAYLSILGEEYGKHLLTASIISAPAAIVASKILFPETDFENTDKELEMSDAELGTNPLEALAIGTTDGLKLALNVGAMLFAFMAVVYLLNNALEGVGTIVVSDMSINEMIASNTRYDALNMQLIFGYLFAPFAWVLGVEGSDVIYIGQMLGEKTALNEFVAYSTLGDMLSSDTIKLNEKSAVIATYALCGFANFASIGIQIGGIGSLAPNQRSTLSKFGIQALVGGTVACFLTAAIAGMFFGWEIF